MEKRLIIWKTKYKTQEVHKNNFIRNLYLYKKNILKGLLDYLMIQYKRFERKKFVYT